MMTISPLQWVGFALSCALIFSAIFYTLQKEKKQTMEGMSLAGRSANAWLVAGSLAGTLVGGSATMGTAQLAYSVGFSASWFAIGSCIGLFILGYVYAKPLRESGLQTLAEFIVYHYGPTAGLITSLISVSGIFFSLVASGLSGLHFIQLLFSCTPLTAAFLLFLIVLAYVLLGGLKGTSISSLIRNGLLYTVLLATGILAMEQLLAYYPSFWSIVTTPKWHPTITELPSLLDNIFSVIIGVTVTQTYVQAVYSGKDVKEAARGCYIAAALVLPLSLPLILSGIAMSHSHASLPAVFTLPQFFIDYLPPLLGGIGLGTLFLTIVGSISGLSLGAATSLTIDIAKPLFHIQNKTVQLYLLRFLLCMATLCAFALSLIFYHTQILTWNFLSFSLRGSGVFLLLFLAVLHQKTCTPKQAAFTIAFSTLCACLTLVFPIGTLTPLDAGISTSFVLLLFLNTLGHEK